MAFDKTQFPLGTGDGNLFELWQWIEKLMRAFDALEEAEMIEEMFH